MSHRNGYLESVAEESPGFSLLIAQSVKALWHKYLDGFTFNEHLSGLLFGPVQSGKTGHLLGVMAKAADEGFRIFILLTTDNVSLQQQTFERAASTLKTFNVCDETDDLKFRTSNAEKPILLVLKKNKNVLKTWKSHLASMRVVNLEPLFLVDDEGDAASLNTRVNSNDQSTINSLIEDIRFRAPSGVFLSSTATPQALILQRSQSTFRPKFAHYEDPGDGYLGGDFFYGDDSGCVRNINEDEPRYVTDNTDLAPQGLRDAILSFLMIAISRSQNLSVATNMLIHPSVRKADHQKVSCKVNHYLESVTEDLRNRSQHFRASALDIWRDLKDTFPTLASFDSIMASVETHVEDTNVVVMNSDSTLFQSYDRGINIIIGGNILGRGLTFPGLHVVYYSRKAKIPQADTQWQHSRIFGYDRIPGLCRVYLPVSLVKSFRQLNEANTSIINVLKAKGFDHISLLVAPNTRPTRPNVVERRTMSILVGGVNYFPEFPVSDNLGKLDSALGQKDGEAIISLIKAGELLALTGGKTGDSFHRQAFLDAISALSNSHYGTNCRLVVRVNRSVSSGTGTLLSPNDRDLSNSHKDELVLTMYRLNGEKELGWAGQPLWVPNIKLPNGMNYYSAN